MALGAAITKPGQPRSSLLPWPLWAAINVFRVAVALIVVTFVWTVVATLAEGPIQDIWVDFFLGVVFMGIYSLPGAVVYLFLLGLLVKVLPPPSTRLAAFVTSPTIVVWPLFGVPYAEQTWAYAAYLVSLCAACAAIVHVHRRPPRSLSRLGLRS